MDKDDIKTPYPMRFSANERKVFYRRAGKLDMSVPDLIRLLVLHEAVDAQIDYLLIQKDQRDTGGKILALLGRQQHANNINQISRSLHCGTFVETPEIITQIDEYGELLKLIREHQLNIQGLRKL